MSFLGAMNPIKQPSEGSLYNLYLNWIESEVSTVDFSNRRWKLRRPRKIFDRGKD